MWGSILISENILSSVHAPIFCWSNQYYVQNDDFSMKQHIQTISQFYLWLVSSVSSFSLKQWASQYDNWLFIGYVTGDNPQDGSKSGRIKNIKYDVTFCYLDVIAKYFGWHYIPFSASRQEN